MLLPVNITWSGWHFTDLLCVAGGGVGVGRGLAVASDTRLPQRVSGTAGWAHKGPLPRCTS